MKMMRKQMDRIGRILIYFLMSGLLCAFCFSTGWTQEESYRLSYTDVFGPLRRPAVLFQHEAHIEALDSEGCGACHHAPDADTGKLVYVEDEEVGCNECPGQTEVDKTPALREALHGSCTGCHRQMKKGKEVFKGPTTCGECHNDR